MCIREAKIVTGNWNFFQQKRIDLMKDGKSTNSATLLQLLSNKKDTRDTTTRDTECIIHLAIHIRRNFNYELMPAARRQQACFNMRML